MRFAFDEDQLAFRDAVRDLLAKECPPDVVRAAWPEGPDGDGARPGEGARADADDIERVWLALADMGVLGIAVPEAQGGLGLTEVDWVLLAEETGYAALPHPFVETVCVAAPLVAAAGDPRADLADLAAGRARFVAAFVERGRRGVLPSWSIAGDHAIVVGDDGPGGDWRAGWLGATTERFSREALDRARLPAEGNWVDTHGSLGSADDAAAAFDRGALGTAAQLVGLGRRMLDMTVGYVAERKQFGVPVGSQQAVKHHLADAVLQLTFAAPAVYRAAWSLATGVDTGHRDVSVAKALASDAARLAGRQALQCHGAIGYTVEYDLHLYLKRAEALARSWGSAGWHRRRVAAALGI